jgi:penicillin-binding protein 2
MKGGIAHSCDIYFYQLALRIGSPDPIAATARQFGLGQRYDIGFDPREQRPGLIPSTQWVKRARPLDPIWHPGETLSVGIGQGAVLVNPLQSCVMCARLANGSKAIMPRLVHSVGGVIQPSNVTASSLPFDPAHMAFIREAMAAVVTEGTAAASAKLDLGPIMMAGKTGTAQSHGGGISAHGAIGAWDLRDHSWFIAFAPFDDPRYAMSVLVEHGGFGAEAAAPRAREIMRVALLKDPEVRARIEQPLPSPTSPPPVTGVSPAANGLAPTDGSATT